MTSATADSHSSVHAHALFGVAVPAPARSRLDLWGWQHSIFAWTIGLAERWCSDRKDLLDELCASFP